MLGNEKKQNGSGAAVQNLKSEQPVESDMQFGEKEAKDLVTAITFGTISVLEPKIKSLESKCTSLQVELAGIRELLAQNKTVVEKTIVEKTLQMSNDLEAKKQELEKNQLTIASNVDMQVKKSLDDATKSLGVAIGELRTKTADFEKLKTDTVSLAKSESQKVTNDTLTKLKSMEDTLQKCLAATGELEAKLHGATIEIQPISAKLVIPMLAAKKS